MSQENQERLSDSDDEEQPQQQEDEPSLSFSQCLSQATCFKDGGNAAFKQKDMKLAQKCYDDGIALLRPHKDIGGPSDDISEEEYSSMISTYVGLQGNLCLLLVKQEDWGEVLASTQEVLKYDAVNVKALYRRGLAQHNVGSLNESKASLSKAVELDPANGAAKKELLIVSKEIKVNKQKEKAALAGAFSSGSMYNDKEKERELRERRAREAEEKLQDDYIKSKLKRRQEGKDEQTFDEYKAELKKEEDIKKKEAEELQKKIPPKVSPSVKKAAVDSDSEDDYDEEEQKIINETKRKGYCYFKNKLDDETSELIGDITPKVTQVASAEHTQVQSSSKVEASSWNHAGTWEERDVTSITKSRLKDTCLGVHVALNGGLDDSSLNDTLSTLSATTAGGGGGDSESLTKSIEKMSNMMMKVSGSITEVKSVDGDAQVVMVGQGKKRQVYDFNISLKFEVVAEDISGDSSKNKTYKGSFDVIDVTPGATYEHKTSFKKSGINAKVDEVVKQLREKVIADVHSFFANDFSNL